jgi:hypothetical protein
MLSFFLCCSYSPPLSRGGMVERLSFSISLIEQDPEVVPDVDIAAQVGKEFFLSLMNRGMNRAKGT